MVQAEYAHRPELVPGLTVYRPDDKRFAREVFDGWMARLVLMARIRDWTRLSVGPMPTKYRINYRILARFCEIGFSDEVAEFLRTEILNLHEAGHAVVLISQELGVPRFYDRNALSVDSPYTRAFIYWDLEQESDARRVSLLEERGIISWSRYIYHMSKRAQTHRIASMARDLPNVPELTGWLVVREVHNL